VDPKTIRLSFTGVDKIEVGPEGDLVLHTAAGRIRQLKPHIYQEVDGVRQAVPGGYVVRGSQHSELTTDNRQLTTPEVGFEVAAYDVSKPLVIDPVLLYSTYLLKVYRMADGLTPQAAMGPPW
jgi:hypothetical protein